MNVAIEDYEERLRMLEEEAERTKENPDNTCKHGHDPWCERYRDVQPINEEEDAEKHGVKVKCKHGDDIGVLYSDCNTVVNRSGGMYVPEDAIVIHNAYYCAKGRLEAAK